MSDDSHQEPGEPQEPPTADAVALAAPMPPPVPAGLRNIWRKWLRVTTRPRVASFAAELPTANWPDIVASVLGLCVLTALIRVILGRESARTIWIPPWSDSGPHLVLSGLLAGAYDVAYSALGFVILSGLLFGIARLFGGKGTFLELAYMLALVEVPLGIVASLLWLVPLLYNILMWPQFIYELVLTTLAFAASQRFSFGEAFRALAVSCLVLTFAACVVISAAVTIFSLHR